MRSRPLRLRLRCALVEIQQCFYGLDASGQEATFIQCFDEIPLPTVVIIESGSDSHLDIVSIGRADQSRVVLCQRPERAQDQAPTSKVC